MTHLSLEMDKPASMCAEIDRTFTNEKQKRI
jgi:hypothetical protein